ncbi:hypothetical protein SISSUDRAFT_1052847 [Sistotremastrum suecicum HHB10207 ss-3]|uniref:Uncharacterized protein n=1 Tax=Sistotremastrum suecicum HHB10207 ss-3 TaxID=1314776 RepID=A0A165ZKY0_9AGAM|nr:hypothetical protein SISSUDRAFT_1052847 [Sistotremastrum suecicum HHB10207 ss-3]
MSLDIVARVLTRSTREPESLEKRKNFHDREAPEKAMFPWSLLIGIPVKAQNRRCTRSLTLYDPLDYLGISEENVVLLSMISFPRVAAGPAELGVHRQSLSLSKI